MHRNVVYFHKIQEEAATEEKEGKGRSSSSERRGAIAVVAAILYA